MGISVFPAAGGGVTPKVQTFTSTGTFTAPSNTQFVEVLLVAGGGGGGAAKVAGATCFGGGGGGGQVIVSRKLPVTGGTAYTVTIGSGGAGATTDAAGADGGDTSFGSLATAYGGGGGGTRGASTDTNCRVRGTSGGSQSAGYAAGNGGGASGLPPAKILGTGAQFDMATGISSITGEMNGAYGTGEVYGAPQSGIDGFGGGGWGGNDSIGSATSWAQVNYYGSGTTRNNVGAVNALANKGGGGGGGSKTGSSAAQNGSNGGSGYAVVVYWS